MTARQFAGNSPEKGIQPVEYILTGESGPDHDKQFTVSVQVNGQVVEMELVIQRNTVEHSISGNSGKEILILCDT